MRDNLNMMEKLVVACFKVLSNNSIDVGEENHEKTVRVANSSVRFKPSTSRI